MLQTPARPAGGLQFVVDPAANGSREVDPETRRFIRRHVMLGKNKGKMRPPRNPAPPSPDSEVPPSLGRGVPPILDCFHTPPPPPSRDSNAAAVEGLAGHAGLPSLMRGEGKPRRRPLNRSLLAEDRGSNSSHKPGNRQWNPNLARLYPFLGHTLAQLPLPPDVTPGSVEMFLRCELIAWLPPPSREKCAPAGSCMCSSVLTHHPAHPAVYHTLALPLGFRLRECIEFDKTAAVSVQQVLTDPVYVHAMLAAAARSWQLALPAGSRDMVRLAGFHTSRTLQALRRRLDEATDEGLRLSDSTIQSVVILAVVGLIGGDLESAKVHMEGLRRLILLRGGIASFWPCPRPLNEVIRADLGVALATGSEPILPRSSPHGEHVGFSHPDLSELLELRRAEMGASGAGTTTATTTRPKTSLWNQQQRLPPPQSTVVGLSSSSSSSSSSTPLRAHPGISSPELRRIWAALADFADAVTFAAATRRHVRSEAFMGAMAASMYPLTSASLARPGTADDAVRLGLLAFGAAMFLPWRDISVRYHRLGADISASLLGLSSSSVAAAAVAAAQLEPGMVVWLLMVGAVAVVGLDGEPWFAGMVRESLVKCGVKSWAEVKGLLESYMWIDFGHDEAAQSILLSCLRS